VDDGRQVVVSKIIAGSMAEELLKVNDQVLAIDGFSYEGAPVEHVKEGLRDVAAECLLVILRRPAEPDNPDASLENILPGLPMSKLTRDDLGANAPRSVIVFLFCWRRFDLLAVLV
jgi:hypothetical protein